MGYVDLYLVPLLTLGPTHSLREWAVSEDVAVLAGDIEALVLRHTPVGSSDSPLPAGAHSLRECVEVCRSAMTFPILVNTSIWTLTVEVDSQRECWAVLARPGEDRIGAGTVEAMLALAAEDASDTLPD